MSSTLGVVEVPGTGHGAETGQGRVAPAARRFGARSLLEWVVRRVTDALLVDQVAVVSDALQGDLVLRLAPPDVSVFVGPQADALARFAAALQHYDAEHVVRVSLSSPFVDPALIDRLVCTSIGHPGADYLGYVASRCGPTVLSRLGVFPEWCTAEAVYRADREATQADERAEATRYIYSHPEIFKLRFSPIPPQLDRDDVRLAVHVEEDWEHAQIIFDALGPESLDWQRIAELLDHQPAMRNRMAVLNQAELGAQ